MYCDSATVFMLLNKPKQIRPIIGLNWTKPVIRINCRSWCLFARTRQFICKEFSFPVGGDVFLTGLDEGMPIKLWQLWNTVHLK